MKKWSVLFILIVSVFFLSPLCFAKTTELRVVDDAALFSQEQIQHLEERILELRESCSADIVVVTTDNAQGKSSMEYADDYYDQYGYGVGDDKTGILYLIDMDNRKAYISTCGKMIARLSDSRIETMLDHAFEGLSSGNYYASAVSFLDDVEQYTAKKPESSGTASSLPVEAITRVFDEAALLNGSEMDELQRNINAAVNKTGVDLAVATTDDTKGKTTKQYAEYLYTHYQMGTGSNLNGAILLIDMENREAYIAAHGVMKEILTDREIEIMLDSITPKLTDMEYLSAATYFIDETSYIVSTSAIQTTDSSPISVKKVLIFLAISLAAGFIVCFIIVKRYRMEIFSYKSDPLNNAQLFLRTREDVFINSSIHEQFIPKSESNNHGGGGGFSGGGSSFGGSSHSSSSGSSHGGGGRGF